MATVGVTPITLSDWAKHLDPDGNVPKIVDMLSTARSVTNDAMMMEGNLETGHRTTMQSTLPVVHLRGVNEGVSASKAETKQVDDACSVIAGYLPIDKLILKLQKDQAGFLRAQESAYLESLQQQFETMFFYGDPSGDPRQFVGLAPRYAVKSADKTNSGYNIITANGAGATNTSIWFVTYHEMSTFLHFPKNSMAGIQRIWKPDELVIAANGGKHPGVEIFYEWLVGLAQPDWRDTVRYQVDVSALTKDAATGADLIDGMVEAWHRIFHVGRGKTVVYCSRTISSFLDRQAMNHKNVNLSVREVSDLGGNKRMVTMFKGAEVKIADAILETEAQIT